MRFATGSEYLDCLRSPISPGPDSMSLTNSRISRGRRMVVAATVTLSASVFARPTLAQRGGGGDPALLTVERIYDPREFTVRRFGPTRWLDDSTYTTIDPAPGGRGGNLVRVDAATGKATVIVPATRLVPSGASGPIEIED